MYMNMLLFLFLQGKADGARGTSSRRQESKPRSPQRAHGKRRSRKRGRATHGQAPVLYDGASKTSSSELLHGLWHLLHRPRGGDEVPPGTVPTVSAHVPKHACIPTQTCKTETKKETSMYIRPGPYGEAPASGMHGRAPILNEGAANQPSRAS